MSTIAAAAPTATSPATELDAAAVKRLLDSGEAVLFDVREPDEHAAERIPGAILMPLSRFDAATVASRARGRVIFHCRSGNRSRDALGRFGATGAAAAHLVGGVQAWKAAGLPVERSKAPPISVMRQVQIVIGLMVLAGTALGVFVNPWFLLLPAFMGAGLTFAGVSGTCGLAVVLSRMPWNRFEGPKSSCSV